MREFFVDCVCMILLLCHLPFETGGMLDAWDAYAFRVISPWKSVSQTCGSSQRRGTDVRRSVCPVCASSPCTMRVIPWPVHPACSEELWNDPLATVLLTSSLITGLLTIHNQLCHK